MRVRVGGRRHNHHRRAARPGVRAPRHWGRPDHRFGADDRERKRHRPPTTDSEDDHRGRRQRRRQDHLVQAAPARVAGCLPQPRCDRPGTRRLEQRRESARSRPDCERRHPEAPRAERELRFREHLYRDVPGPGSYARQPRTGTPSGRCSLARTEPRSTSSGCVNASGPAPDTTSRSRRSRGGGQQLRKTLPETAASLGAIDVLDNSHGVTRHVARITKGEIRLPTTPTPACGANVDPTDRTAPTDYLTRTRRSDEEWCSHRTPRTSVARPDAWHGG